MKTRMLTLTGLKGSAIGYGAIGLDSGYGPATSRREAIEIVGADNCVEPV
jgi:aryl-alcohol dehydrogenase-like predicted oxidoreductase